MAQFKPRAEILNVIVAADESYVKPMAALLASILTNLSAPKAVRFYVLDSGISHESIEKIRGVVDRLSRGKSTVETLVPPNEIHASFETVTRFTPSVYLRLLIPDLLPVGTRRALYLDCDMIVFDDLRKLWRTRFKQPVAAVYDLGMPYLGMPYLGDQLWISDDTQVFPFPLLDHYQPKPATPYFNSGLLLIDIAQWKKAKITEKALEYVRLAKGQLRLPDQDALNIAVLGNWHPLSVRWNLPLTVVPSAVGLPESPGRTELLKHAETYLRKPGIFHWLGPLKPWNSALVNAPYEHFLALSGWDKRAQ